MVVVNLYPFVKAAANPATPFETLVEEIDIGGPSLVRAAAKNFRGVLVVVDPADYSRLLTALDAGRPLGFRFELMRKAIAHTASYDTAITQTLEAITVKGAIRAGRRPRRCCQTRWLSRSRRSAISATAKIRINARPGTRAESATSAAALRPTILQGKELSYTNLLDLDAASRIVLEFDEPAAAVIKHTNPCGAAIGRSAVDAYVRAREADSLAAFGGIVALNRAIDVAVAEAIVSTFIEAVIAPGVDDARQGDPRPQAKHARRGRRLHALKTRSSSCARSRRDPPSGARLGGRGAAAVDA